jgi:multicomponent Na+:H+ antiporter subunit G
MMDLLVYSTQILGILLIFAGAFFFIAATVGVIRMPDPYNRGHVAGKGDSPGFLLCLGGIWLYWMTISPGESLKVLVITFFMLLANPIAVHSILRLCFHRGVKFCDGTVFIKEVGEGRFAEYKSPDDLYNLQKGDERGDD